jgi:hypothetical protein
MRILNQTFINTFTGRSIWAVDYGPTGQSSPLPPNVFVAGGDYGAAAYSADGVTWTAIPNVTNGQTINGIANNGSGTFIMVANNGILAYTSNIASGQWTTVANTQILGTIYAIAYGEKSGRFIIGGYAGYASYSDDNGVTWFAIKQLQSIFAHSNNSDIRAIASFDDYDYSRADVFVAVGGRSGPYPMPSAVGYSRSNGDDNSWHTDTNNVFCRGITFVMENNTPNFIASGYDMNGAASKNITYVNSDNLGFNMWNPISESATGVSGWLNCIAYGGQSNNGYYVAGGAGGKIAYTQSLLSSQWTLPNISMFTGFVNGIAYGDVTLIDGSTGRFVAVGDGGVGAYTTLGVVPPQPSDN